jgi:uncharacterized protein YhhL (DUF1145 family)
MNKFIALNKLVLVCFCMPFAGAADQWVMLIGLAMFIVHLIEFFVMRKRLQGSGHSGAMNFLLVMLFGILYWKPLLRD